MLLTVRIQTLINYFLQFNCFVRIELFGILFKHDFCKDIVLYFLVLWTEYDELLDDTFDTVLEKIKVFRLNNSSIRLLDIFNLEKEFQNKVEMFVYEISCK